MSRSFEEFGDYVSVAERRAQAERAVAKLRRKDPAIAPVIIERQAIAATFWGKAWCKNLESYRDFESRLPRGRSYVRNRAVLDLKIAPLRVDALVCGSEIYEVEIKIAEAPRAQWRSICADCAGGIDSLVELLRGRLSERVMERLCRQGKGLFPKPSEIDFTCDCPDYAYMCKHVAAVFYGIGARLDESPELLFRLRGVDANDLLTGIDAATPLAKTAPATGKILKSDDISALFGLEMAPSEAPPAAPSTPRPKHKTKRRAREA